jgi:galactonate dehydratase
MFRGSFFRGGPFVATAIAGIEQALWDIKGKYYNLPVYEFLGGLVRQKVRAYAWVGGDRPTEVVVQVKERIRQGFTGVKMNVTEELHYIDDGSKVDSLVARVAAVRQEVDSEYFIALDFHGRVHRAIAKRLVRALEPYALGWIEEPLLSEHNDLLAAIVGNTATPLATGERLYNRWDFKSIFESRVIDIVQPDASLTGLYKMEKSAVWLKLSM